VIAIDPKKLDGLEVDFDNNPPGHVTVRPKTFEELREWASTWRTGIRHKFTDIVTRAIKHKFKWKDLLE
jgi:hypothetical protein